MTFEKHESAIARLQSAGEHERSRLFKMLAVTHVAVKKGARSQRPGGLNDKTGNFLHPVADGDGPHLGCNVGRLITKRPRDRTNSAPAQLQTQRDSKSAGETTPGDSRLTPPLHTFPASAATAPLCPRGGRKQVCLQCRPTTHRARGLHCRLIHYPPPPTIFTSISA